MTNPGLATIIAPVRGGGRYGGGRATPDPPGETSATPAAPPVRGTGPNPRRKVSRPCASGRGGLGGRGGRPCTPEVRPGRIVTKSSGCEEPHNEQTRCHHRGGSLRSLPASRVSAGASPRRGHPGPGVLREAVRLGGPLALHLADRPRRVRRAGALQHVPVPVDERAEGIPRVRRLLVRGALRQGHSVLSAVRGPQQLHPRTGGEVGRAQVRTVRHGGPPRHLVGGDRPVHGALDGPRGAGGPRGGVRPRHRRDRALLGAERAGLRGHRPLPGAGAARP